MPQTTSNGEEGGEAAAGCGLLQLPSSLLGQHIYSHLHAHDMLCVAMTCKELHASWPEAVQHVRCLDFSYMEGLQGMPFDLPPQLQELDLTFTAVEALPRQFPPTLHYLDCHNTDISTLPSLPESLLRLDCSATAVSTLAPLPSSLQFLDCHSTNISALPPQLPASLRYLDCSHTAISTLPQPFPAPFSHLYLSDFTPSSLPQPHSKSAFCMHPQTITQSVSVQWHCSNTGIETLPQLPASIHLYHNNLRTLTLPEPLPAFLCFLGKQLR